jgi:5-formyltetrahydrofolate cyclo-ligase
MAATDPSARKHALRDRMREVRRAIPPERRLELARLAEAHLLALPEVRSAGTILLFSSFGTEIPTAALIERLLAEGHRVLLPYLTEDGDMDAAAVVSGQALVPTSYGPTEPPERVAVDPEEVDAVIAPGLAFDRRGRRLGYGGGNYDRYLGRLPARAVRIGIGFSAQLVEEVPGEPGDERMDLVVTDTGVTDCRAR